MNPNVKYFNQLNYPDLMKNKLTRLEDIKKLLIKAGYRFEADNNRIRLNFGSGPGCKSFIEYKKDIIDALFEIEQVSINDNYVIITQKN